MFVVKKEVLCYEMKWRPHRDVHMVSWREVIYYIPSEFTAVQWLCKLRSCKRKIVLEVPLINQRFVFSKQFILFFHKFCNISFQHLILDALAAISNRPLF